IGQQETVSSSTDDLDEVALTTIPAVPIPRIPAASQLWRRALWVAWAVVAVFSFDRLTLLLSDYWLLQSLGFSEVFWTNFRMGAVLFVAALLVFTAAVALPAFTHPLSQRGRRFALGVATLVGLLGGYALTAHYQKFLL